MAERPQIRITQIVEQPQFTGASTKIMPVILGDLRQSLTKVSTGIEHDNETESIVPWPGLDIQAVPIVRYADDVLLAGHDRVPFYKSWDLHPDAAEALDEILRKKTAGFHRSDARASGTFDTPFQLVGSPVVHGTVTVRGKISHKAVFADGDEGVVYTVSIASGNFRYVTGAGEDETDAAAAIKALLDESSLPVTTDLSGATLTITAEDAGFFFTVTGSASGAGSLSITDETEYFAEGDDYTVDYSEGQITAEASLATFGSTNDIGIDYVKRPPFSAAVYLRFEDTYSTVPRPPQIVRLSPADYILDATGIRVLPGQVYPASTNIRISGEPHTFNATALDSADQSFSLAHNAIISGSVSVTGVDGNVYKEGRDFTVDYETGEITLRTSTTETASAIDEDDVSVVFVSYRAAFPGNPLILVSYLASRVTSDGMFFQLNTKNELKALASGGGEWDDAIDLRQPLLCGMSIAMDVASGNAIAGMAMRDGDNLDSVLEELGKRDIYFTVPMTYSLAVHLACLTHSVSMSVPEEGTQRVAQASIMTPEQAPIYPDTENGVAAAAFVDAGSGTLIDENWNESTALPRAGDYVMMRQKKFRIAGAEFVDGTGAVFYLSGISSIGEADPSDTIPTGAPTGTTHYVYYRVFRELTRDEMVEAINDARGALANFRAWLRLPDILTYAFSTGQAEVPGFMRNAYQAGLMQSILPHQPMTNFPLSRFTALRHSNFFFTRTEMDQIIENGVDIAVEEGGVVASLRQLTTETTMGLERAEQSVVISADFASKRLRTRIKQFIGRYNITDNLIAQIRFIVQGEEEALKLLSNDQAGPLVERIDIVSLERMKGRKDALKMKLRYVFQAPFNAMDIDMIITAGQTAQQGAAA